MQKKLLTNFSLILLLAASLGSIGCASVNKVSIENDTGIQNIDYSIEQNETGVFVICELPCDFNVKGIQLKGEPMSTSYLNKAVEGDKDKFTLITSREADYTANFKFGKSELDTQEIIDLEEFIQTIEKKPNQTINLYLRGFTDDIGPEEYNLRLATQRIDKVTEVLNNLGFDVTESRALGKCCYLATNETPEGRQANRRVEIFFDIFFNPTYSRGYN